MRYLTNSLKLLKLKRMNFHRKSINLIILFVLIGSKSEQANDDDESLFKFRKNIRILFSRTNKEVLDPNQVSNLLGETNQLFNELNIDTQNKYELIGKRIDSLLALSYFQECEYNLNFWFEFQENHGLDFKPLIKFIGLKLDEVKLKCTDYLINKLINMRNKMGTIRMSWISLRTSLFNDIENLNLKQVNEKLEDELEKIIEITKNELEKSKKRKHFYLPQQTNLYKDFYMINAKEYYNDICSYVNDKQLANNIRTLMNLSLSDHFESKLDISLKDIVLNNLLCVHLENIDSEENFGRFLMFKYGREHIFDLVFSRNASVLLPSDTHLLLKYLANYSERGSDKLHKKILLKFQLKAQESMIPIEDANCSVEELHQVSSINIGPQSPNIYYYYKDRLPVYLENCVERVNVSIRTSSVSFPNEVVSKLIKSMDEWTSVDWTEFDLEPCTAIDVISRYMIELNVNVSGNKKPFRHEIERLDLKLTRQFWEHCDNHFYPSLREPHKNFFDIVIQFSESLYDPASFLDQTSIDALKIFKLCHAYTNLNVRPNLIYERMRYLQPSKFKILGSYICSISTKN